MIEVVITQFRNCFHNIKVSKIISALIGIHDCLSLPSGSSSPGAIVRWCVLGRR